MKELQKKYKNIIINKNNFKYVKFLDDFKNHLKKQITFNTQKDKFKNLLILGKPSLGKTYLVKNIFKDFTCEDRSSSKSVFYIDETTFVERIYSQDAIIRPSSDFGADITKYLLEWMAKVPLLIYDDIGTIANNNKIFNIYLQKMNFILNKRIKNNKRTIVISNLTRANLENLDKRIGERIQSNAGVLIFKSDELKNWRKESSVIIDI